MEYKYPAGTGGGGAADTAKSLLITVRNNTGVTIPERSPVYINGALGNRPTVALAYNTTDATSSKVIGFTVNDIPDNTDGNVIAFGRLEKVDTQDFDPGDALYLGSTPGSITTTKPSAPNHMVFLGIVVISNPANGIIEVEVQNGYELEELHNVQISLPDNKQTIIYDSTTSLWKNALLPVENLAPALADANKAIVRDASGNVVSAPIVNANIAIAADIAVSKLASLAANKLVVTDSSGKLAANSGTVSNNEVVAYNAGTLYTVAGITNTKVGYLSNVTSDIQAQINSKLATTLKGALNGLAELDGSGKVPSSQLPSYVDDVLEYANLAAFPAIGADGIIYIALDTNLCYRWGGSTYVEISPSLALGETSTTAYRGDRGKIAYDHSQTTGNPHSTAIGDISGLQTALDGKFDDPTGTSVQYIAGDGTIQSFPTYYQANKVVILAANGTASTIAKGTPVYASSAFAGKLRVSPARSNSYIHNEKLLGLTAEAINAGADGLIVISGLLENINTSAFLAGQSMWLDSTAGTMTFTKPEAPLYASLLGYCVVPDATVGIMHVNVKSGKDFADVRDVLIVDPQNSDVLQYESSSSLWKNKVLLKASNTLLIAQVGHSLNLGEAVYLNGSVYTKALASAANTAEVVGIVSRVVDVDSFELTLSGEIAGLSGLTAGGVYFLSSAIAGLVTMLEPTAIGQISIPLAVAKSSTSLYVDIKRGVVVGSANARTQVALANSATTSVQNVSSYDAGELAGWVHISGTASQKFYVQAQFVKGADTIYDIAYQVVGDTPPAGFSIAVTNAGVIQAVMPTIAGFTGAFINYALNAPAVGTNYPITVDSTNINVVDSAPLSYRNKIINGNFDIWQRGTPITQTQDIASLNSYTADRWKMGAVRDGVAWRQITVTRESTIVPTASRYAAKVTLGAADCNRVTVEQRIESGNSFVFNSQNGVLQFKLRRIATLHASTTMSVQIYSPNAADNYTTSTLRTAKTFTNMSSLSNTDYTTFTVDVPFNAAFSNGLDITITLNTDAVSTPLAGIGDLFYFAQAQMEVGLRATAFEQRPIGMELSLCQRYAYNIITAGGTRNGFFKATNTTSDMWVYHPVPMRASPVVTGSITITPYNYVTGTTLASTSAYTSILSSTQSIILGISGHGAGTAGAGASFDLSAGLLVVSAEL